MQYFILLLLPLIVIFSGKAQSVSFAFDTVCVGNTATLSAITDLSVNDTNYVWDFNGDNVFDDATGETVSYQTQVSGNYVGLKVISGINEYTSYNSVPVHYIPSAEFRILSVPCQDETLEFENQSAVYKASIEKVYWDFTNDGGFDDTVNTSNTEYSYSGTGLQSARLRVVSDKGCVDETTENFTILNKPEVNFSYSGHCLGNQIIFTDQSDYIEDSIVSYKWSMGNGFTSTNLQDISHIYNNAGIYPVKLAIYYLNECADSLEVNITIDTLPALTINANPDTMIFEGNEAILSIMGNYDDILWSTGVTIDSINVSETGTYWCKVTQNGCSSTDTINIVVYPIEQVLIENNIMTPNGDGINDYFIIKDIESYEKCAVSIFNRYGKEVYTNLDYQNDWNGDFNGVPLPAGAYYYSISTGDYTTTGNINILR